MYKLEIMRLFSTGVVIYILQNDRFATFCWAGTPEKGACNPEIRTRSDLRTVHLPTNFIILCFYSFGSYRVVKQTDKQTHPRRERFGRKHPPCAPLRYAAVEKNMAE